MFYTEIAVEYNTITGGKEELVVVFVSGLW